MSLLSLHPGILGEGEDLTLKVVPLRVEPAVRRAHGDTVRVDDVEVVTNIIGDVGVGFTPLRQAISIFSFFSAATR